MTTNSDDSYHHIAPPPTISESVPMFDNLDIAIGWAIEANDDGLLMPEELVSFCKDLKAYHDPYARSVALTGWAEEVKARRELAANITDSD